MIRQRLQDLGWELPEFTPPRGKFVPAVLIGNTLTTSGYTSSGAGPWACYGKLGREIDTETGYLASRQAVLNLLAAAEVVLGDLNRIERLVKVNGYVNSDPDFTNQTRVVDGASEAFVSIFGEAGQHARTAVGVATLPRGAAVEIEGTFLVR